MRPEASNWERQLAELYRERYDAFLHVAVGITRDEELARDAVQEGFSRALRRVRSYGGWGSIEAWTWPIVLNAARNIARQQRRRPPDPELAVVAEAAPPPDPELREAISRLPDRERIALFLRYYADLDYESIADILGVTVGTVSASLHSARKKLFDQLEGVHLS